MKRIFFISVAVLLLAAVSADASAQGFLKKVGKVLDKAETVLNNGTATTPAGRKEDNLVAIPGVTLQITGVCHDGLGAVVDFTMTNASQNIYDLTFNGTNGLDGWSKSLAVGGDGVARSCYVRSIGDKESMDMVTRYSLLPGTTVAGSFKINQLSREVTELKSISIAGIWLINNDVYNHNFRFNVDGLKVTTPDNTNADNVYCTLPCLKVALDKVERKNSAVYYYLTLQNTGKMAIDLTPGMGYVKDIAGKDDYKFSMAIDGEELSGYSPVTFEPGRVKKGVFCVMGVATSVKAMDDVLWMLLRPEYFISIRNQPIP